MGAGSVTLMARPVYEFSNIEVIVGACPIPTPGGRT